MIKRAFDTLSDTLEKPVFEGDFVSPVKFERSSASVPIAEAVVDEVRPSISPKIIVLGVLSLIVGLFSFGFQYWSSSVSASKLHMPLYFDRAYTDDGVLYVKTTTDAWDQLTKSQRRETFLQLEVYAREQGLRQVIIFDHDRSYMGAIASGKLGRSSVYAPRVFRK